MAVEVTTLEKTPHLELAAIQRRAFRAKAPALLFTRVKGTPFPMLSNLFGTRERLHFIFRHSLPAVEAVLTVNRIEPERNIAVADVRVTTSDGRLVIAAEHLLYCYQETA